MQPTMVIGTVALVCCSSSSFNEQGCVCLRGHIISLPLRLATRQLNKHMADGHRKDSRPEYRELPPEA